MWENVESAFSSNLGEDFRAVLEAFVNIKEEGVQVPAPDKGKWSKADVLLGDGWSVAYRTFDSQYWLVPQRRKRIYLVADFAGESAGEILFKSGCMPWYFEKGFNEGEGIAGCAEEGAGETGEQEARCVRTVQIETSGEEAPLMPEFKCFDRHGSTVMGVGNTIPVAFGISRLGFTGVEKAALHFAVDKELSPTFIATGPHAVSKSEIKAYGVCSKSSNGMLSDNPHSGFYEAHTSRTLDQCGGNPTCNQGGIAIVASVPDEKETYDVRFTSDGTKNARGHCYKTDISRCLDTGGENPDGNHGGVAVVEKQPVVFTQNQRNEVRDLGERAGALSVQPGMKQQTYVLQGSMLGREDRNGPRGDGINEEICFTLNTVDRHAVAMSPGKGSTYCATTGDFTTISRDVSNPLMARDYKSPQILNDNSNDEAVYIVRRLTPVECARLQGFPDWWCSDLAIPNPSDEELDFWVGVWSEWDALGGKKPKTEKQIRKWLAAPYHDKDEYALWGNGITLTVANFVLSGIAWAAQR